MDMELVRQIKEVSNDLTCAQDKLEGLHLSFDQWSNRRTLSMADNIKHGALCRHIEENVVKPLSKELETLAERLNN